MRPTQFTRAGCTVRAVPPGARVRVEISAEAAPEPNAATAREWAVRTARNPRLFDGGILAVVSMDESVPGELTIAARHDRYQRLAVQPAVENSVSLLAIRGVVTARDRRGTEHVFLGKRDARTHEYGGMWELGPSGGVQPPGPGVREVGPEELIALYGLELREEAGMDVGRARCAAVATCVDHAARGSDLVLSVAMMDALETITESERDWEYAEVRWIAVSDFASVATGLELSPPTMAIAAMLGWVR